MRPGRCRAAREARGPAQPAVARAPRGAGRRNRHVGRVADPPEGPAALHHLRGRKARAGLECHDAFLRVLRVARKDNHHREPVPRHPSTYPDRGSAYSRTPRSPCPHGRRAIRGRVMLAPACVPERAFPGVTPVRRVEAGGACPDVTACTCAARLDRRCGPKSGGKRPSGPRSDGKKSGNHIQAITFRSGGCRPLRPQSSGPPRSRTAPGAGRHHGKACMEPCGAGDQGTECQASRLASEGAVCGIRSRAALAPN
jgi:hypothetical protein